VRRGLSAGRVQSVALRLIVEREKEIQAFKPVEYWEVDALLKHQSQEFPARVIRLGKDTYEPKSASDVDHVVADLKTAAYTVTTVERTQRKRASLPPFTTSTLQQAAANRLGWSAKQTMRAAQELYEEGLITYHRTDSVALSTQALDAARGTLRQRMANIFARYCASLRAQVRTRKRGTRGSPSTDVNITDIMQNEVDATGKACPTLRSYLAQICGKPNEAAIYDEHQFS
jgi:DNA topoisomerase IA